MLTSVSVHIHVQPSISAQTYSYDFLDPPVVYTDWTGKHFNGKNPLSNMRSVV